jgi:hypothetical protein
MGAVGRRAHMIGEATQKPLVAAAQAAPASDRIAAALTPSPGQENVSGTQSR